MKFLNISQSNISLFICICSWEGYNRYITKKYPKNTTSE